MKKIVALLFLSCLFSTIANCQLLSNPSLTIEDFEKAFSNPVNLRKIFRKHNFDHFTLGKTKIIEPGTMPNPLLPDFRAFKSEHWVPKDQGDQAIVEISIYEWEPDYAPQPEVIKTIRVMIRRDTAYAGKTNKFLEAIKNNYPNRSKRYLPNTELYKSDEDSFDVFTNDSKIEVRMEKEIPVFSRFYVVNFDLTR